MDEKRPPIEPGPEPDTTDAAEADDVDARIEPEDAPDILDDGEDHLDDVQI